MNILSFDIGGTAIKYALTDETCLMGEMLETPTEAHLGGMHIVEKLMDIIAQYDDVDLVAVSTAGQVDYENGRIKYANDNIPNYTGTEIAKIIRGRFDIPVYVENDANCAALGEAKFGAAKGTDSCFCLTYGTGIGGGIFLNGEIYHGEALSAGEFGHLVTHPDGRRCGCGGRGCYEAYASCSALVRSIEEQIGHETNAREIFAPENFSQPLYRVSIDRWIDEIVFGLVSLVHIFNPKSIVLGGGVMNEDYVVDEVKRRVRSKIMPEFRVVEISRAKLGNRAGLTGAAYYALKRYNEEK